MARFEHLPYEIVFLIAQLFDQERDLNSLCRVSRTIHWALDPLLYTRHVRHHTGTKTLNWAREHDRANTVKKLLGALARVHRPGDGGLQALQAAAIDGKWDVVKLSLEMDEFDPEWLGTDPKFPGVLALAAMNGPREIMELLLRHPGTKPQEVDGHFQTPLMHAAENGRADIVEMLLGDPRIDPAFPCRRGGTAVSRAASRRTDNTRVLGILLADPRIDANKPDVEGRTPAYFAASSADGVNLRPLIEAGAHLDVRADNGETPLWIAAKAGRTKAVKMLLEAPGDLDVNVRVGSDWRSPLVTAIHRGYEDIVGMLCQDPRVDLNLPDDYGRTPLIAAVYKGRLKFVTLLCQNPRVLPNLVDASGRSALAWASTRKRSPCKPPLLSHPDIDIRLSEAVNQNGDTA